MSPALLERKRPFLLERFGVIAPDHVSITRDLPFRRCCSHYRVAFSAEATLTSLAQQGQSGRLKQEEVSPRVLWTTSRQLKVAS
jgi:hypothetical protein